MPNTPTNSAAYRAALGRRIVAARLGAGFVNAAEFARAVGVSPNTIYRWEGGAIAPDIYRVCAVARAARVTVDWLLTGESPSAGPQLAAWLATPRGQSAGDDAVRFLERLPLDGYTPTPAFFDLALLAFEQGLSPEDASLAARHTESLRLMTRRNSSREG